MGDSLINKIIIMLNTMKTEFDQKFKCLIDCKDFELESGNPLQLVINNINKLRDLSEQSGFDIFGEASYIKLIYLSYFEAFISDMLQQLAGLAIYYNSNFFHKLRYKEVIVDIIDSYNSDYEYLANFKPELFLDQYKLMLYYGGYFEWVKPQMYYKYTAAVIEEAKTLGFNLKAEIDNGTYDPLFEKVRRMEEKLEENEQSVDYSSYDEVINNILQIFHVDLNKLDKDAVIIKKGFKHE